MANYHVGRRFEQKIARWARNHGFIAMRSAGSKSPIDVAIYTPEKVVLIQCKVARVQSSGWHVLHRTLRRYKLPLAENVHFVVVSRNRSKGVYHIFSPTIGNTKAGITVRNVDELMNVLFAALGIDFGGDHDTSDHSEPHEGH